MLNIGIMECSTAQQVKQIHTQSRFSEIREVQYYASIGFHFYQWDLCVSLLFKNSIGKKMLISGEQYNFRPQTVMECGMGYGIKNGNSLHLTNETQKTDYRHHFSYMVLKHLFIFSHTHAYSSLYPQYAQQNMILESIIGVYSINIFLLTCFVSFYFTWTLKKILLEMLQFHSKIEHKVHSETPLPLHMCSLPHYQNSLENDREKGRDFEKEGRKRLKQL